MILMTRLYNRWRLRREFLHRGNACRRYTLREFVVPRIKRDLSSAAVTQERRNEALALSGYPVESDMAEEHGLPLLHLLEWIGHWCQRHFRRPRVNV